MQRGENASAVYSVIESGNNTMMYNLHYNTENFNNFYNSIKIENRKYYRRIDKRSLKHGNGMFLVLITILRLADYCYHYTQVKTLHKALSGILSISQINRLIASRINKEYVKPKKGLIRISPTKQSRPINIKVIDAVKTPETAFIARCFIWLAFYRGSWLDITVEQVQHGLRCNNDAARLFHKHIVYMVLHGVTKKELRKRIFRCERPEWMKYINKVSLPKCAKVRGGLTKEYNYKNLYAPGAHSGNDVRAGNDPGRETGTCAASNMKFSRSSGMTGIESILDIVQQDIKTFSERQNFANVVPEINCSGIDTVNQPEPENDDNKTVLDALLSHLPQDQYPEFYNHFNKKNKKFFFKKSKGSS